MRCCILAHTMKGRTLIAFLVMWVSLLLLAALLSPYPGRASSGSNLLQNPGFEEGTEGWLADSPTTTEFITVTQPVHSGDWAASLNRTDGVPGQIYIYQDVQGIIGGMAYTLGGYAYKNDQNFGWVKLRLDWRDSSGSLLTVDSPLLTEDQPAYQVLSTGSVLAPANATVARVEGVAYIVSSNPQTPVFFDDLSFTFQGSQVYLPLVVKNY
ncbi:MAG: hypothetical protein MUP04_09845 [Anaerolineae bacterium]|nr:hypothetical protein [Anaerolineae bacterium]